MKKLITALYSWFFLGILAVSAQNAPVTTISNVTACPNTVINVPVTVTGFNNIGAASLKILYNPAVLSGPSFTNTSGVLAPLSFSNPSAGVITISGLNTVAGGESLPDGSVFFTLTFTYLGGATNLAFDHTFVTDCQYGGPTPLYDALNDSPKSSYFIDGIVSCETVNPSISCVANQGRFTLGAVYTTVGTEFDNTGSSDNCASPLTISNNLNGLSTLNGYNFPLGNTNVIWSATDACGNVGTCSFTVNVQSLVPPDAPITTVPSVGSCPGQTVNFPVTVTDFVNIGAASFTINYNPAVLTSPSFTNTSGLLSLSFNNPAPGTVLVSGSSLTPGGHSLPDGSTFFTLSFTYLGGSSAVAFDHTFTTNNQYGGPTPTFTALNDSPKSSYYIDGMVSCETVDPVIVCPTSPQIRHTSTTSYITLGTEFDLVSASDNCSSSLTITNNINGNPTLAGFVFNLGSTNVIWTVTDDCGNVATCNFVVEVQGAPITIISNVTSCPGQVVQVPVIVYDFNNIGAASFTINYDAVALSSPGFTNTSGVLPLGFSNPSPGVILVSGLSLVPGGHSLPDGSTFFTLSFTYNGGPASIAFDHTFATNCQYGGPTPLFIPLYDQPKSSYFINGGVSCETIPPTVNCPLSPQIRLTGSPTYTTLGTEFDPLSAFDNCSSVITLINNLNGTATLAGYVFGLGTTTVIWSASDNCGNVGTCSFDVLVQGAPMTIIPTIESCPGTTVNFPVVVNSFNNIGAASFLITYNPAVLTSPSFVNTSGLLNLSSFIPGPGSITVSGSSLVAGGHTLPDGSVLFTLSFTYLGGSTAVAFDHTFITNSQYGGPTPTFDPLYDTPKSAYFIDGAISCETVPPTITCPLSPQIMLTGTPTYTTVGTEFDLVSYSDNCTPTPSLVVTNNLNAGNTLAGYVFSLGTTNVVWTVTDGCGNVSTCTFDVMVQGAPITIIPTIDACPGATVNFPVEVYSFNNIGAASFTITYNPAVLTSPSFSNTSGLLSLGYFSPGPGSITVSGSSLTPGGHSLPDGSILFTLSFTYLGGSTAVAFDHTFNTNCQYGGPTPTFMPLYDTPKSAYFIDGAISCETIAPSITCPPDQNLDLLAGCSNVLPDYTGLAVATDNCSPVTLTQSPIPGTVVTGVGTVLVTITATDPCLNVNSCSFTVNLLDNEPPVALCQNITVALDATGNATILASQIDNGSTDNCGIASITVAPGAFTCTELGPNTVVLTVTDNSGNTATCTATVTVVDLIPPIITTPVGALDVTVECSDAAGIAAALAMAPTATDNCTNPVIIVLVSDVTTVDPLCPQGYTQVRTWNLSDASANTVSYVQTITVQDITAPVLTGVPADVTVDCSTMPIAVPVVTVSDNCDPAPVLTFTEVSTQGVNPALCSYYSYTVTRTWSAVDACGNAVAATQTITVSDIIAPTFPGLVPVVSLTCNPLLVIPVPALADNCDPAPSILSFTDVITPGACPQSYTIARTWVAIDACGNTASALQTFNIFDNTAPVISALPATVTVECSDPIPAWAVPTAIDDCDPAPALTFVDATIPGACPQAFTLTRTWTATDACGNFSTAMQTIIVTDVTAPVIAALPAPSTINCPAVPVFAPLSATDNCDPAPAVTFVDVTTPGACPQAYTVVRTWTVTDACGNAATASESITVVDVTAPVLSIPANITINCEDSSLPANTGTATATDDCSVPVITFSDLTITGSCPGNYIIARTWSATDDCGNVSTSNQIITVQDITAPALVGVPANVAIDCASPIPTYVVTATDNCDAAPIVSLSVASTQGATTATCSYFNYTITNTWTATDNCGNTSTGVQVITVSDNTAPVFGPLPPLATVSCGTVVVFTTPTLTDNCDPSPILASFNDVYTPGSCPQEYSITRTWVASDICGNTSTSIQVYNVVDVVAPVIAALPATTTVNCDAIPAFAVATATDNCDPTPVLTFVDATIPGSCPQSYTLTRTWTATDACGNFSTAVQTINVVDATAPVISALPAPTSISCTAGAPVFATPTATDNCDPAPSLTFADATVTVCANGYTVTRTWTATDACGNVSVATQVISVVDIVAPVISALPAPSTVICPAVPVFATPTVTDDCDASPSLTFADATTPGVCTQEYTVVRTWTATDACGNVSVASQSISVVDNTPPTVVCPPANETRWIVFPVVTYTTVGTEFDPISYSDDCGTATATNNLNGLSSLAGYAISPGTTTIIWTINDGCGNVVTCTTTVVIIQGYLPVSWLSFEASLSGENSILLWQTASEINNSHFEVYRRHETEGDFTQVGVVPGSGTTSVISSYDYSDWIGDQLNGTIYYKIRQVDYDGKSSWTGIEDVYFSVEADDRIVVYPVPSNGQVTVQFNGISGAYNLTVLNVLGQVYRSVKIEGSTAQLDLSDLPNGVYNIRVTGSGVDVTKQILILH